MKKHVILEKRYFKNNSEFNFLLTQLDIEENDDIEMIEFYVLDESIEITKR